MTQFFQGQPYKITEVWACIALHSDGTEGIMAVGSFPIVFTDKTKMPLYQRLAQRAARETGIPNVIRHYTLKEQP